MTDLEISGEMSSPVVPKKSKIRWRKAEMESRPEEGTLMFDEEEGEPMIRRFHNITVPLSAMCEPKELRRRITNSIKDLLHADGWELAEDLKLTELTATHFTSNPLCRIARGYSGKPKYTLLDQPTSLQEVFKKP